MAETVMERRNFLKAAAAVVVGFSSEKGKWIPEAHAAEGDFDVVPPLDGELLTDPTTRAEEGQDLGQIVFDTPAAVLRPGSIEDIAKMVRFCKRRGIVVAPQGQAHSTHGQSQAKSGLAIDMTTLSQIHEIGPGYVVVDAGSTWANLLGATVAQGQTPPVLTGFQGLSIGGTLSMGGISGMAYNRGVQVEHVLECTVVTGRGRIEHCSRTHNRFLFDAVLAGVGQYGIIARVKLELVPAKARAIDHTLLYTDLSAFMADMRTLIAREELDMVWGMITKDENGWVYQLLTTAFYDPPDVPDTDYMLRDLSFDPNTAAVIDGTYLDYQLRVDGLIAFLRSIGVFDGFMHPWYDVFLPDATVETHVGDALDGLGPDDVGTFGFVLLFPLKTSTAERPLFRLPDDDLVYLFDILTAANFPGYDAEYADRMIARNRALYEDARALGGTRYPIGTLDFVREDWRKHYGKEWPRALLAKKIFDPRGILAPGPKVFSND